MARKTRPCLRCNATIPASRCAAFPETRICVTCSEAIGGEFVYEAVTRGLSKGGIKITGMELVAVRARRKVVEPIQ
jgi:hypothetical protein